VLNIIQKDENGKTDYSMPDGPLLLSPDRMAKSFYREVIKRRPDLFKI
jgi:phosphatidate phosphatase LPIN